MVKKDKREDTRLEIRMEGTATFSTKGKETEIEVIAKNISAWGAYCITEIEPNAGDEVRLLLDWSPEDKQAEIVFKARGTVLRVEPMSEEEGCGFAVEFSEIPVIEEGTD